MLCNNQIIIKQVVSCGKLKTGYAYGSPGNSVHPCVATKRCVCLLMAPKE